ncbi:MAG: carboxypeptidase-like regulatory domain-containing protein, partial [Muribaculaceae bacterium]|nr:carboxypeptidase-like regulatory domain-containing protein [Muribaculaceae bacterium]
MRKITFFILISLLSFLPALAQEMITVSGVVVDAATQEPLIGATILVKGPATGTSTGIDGDFSLKVAVGSTLQVSYIG